MKASFDRQQTIFKKQNTEREKNTKAGYIVSYLIAKKMKPFTEGEFIKECMINVVREVCPKKKGAFEYISLSTRTMTRRSEELPEDVKEKLQDSVNSFQYYVFNIMNAKYTAQLAIFVQGINPEFTKQKN